MTKRIVSALVLLGLAAVGVGKSTTNPTTRPTTRTAAAVFEAAGLRTVHLHFAPDQWAAMEPAGGGNPFGGGPGGPGGGPGGPGGGPGGPGGFDPGRMIGMFVGPVFMREGDADHDGKLSPDEFRALAGKWFAAWDKKEAGALTSEQLGDGLGVVLAPPPGPQRVGLQGPEGKRNGVASMMGIEFKYVHAALEFDGDAVKDVGARYKGNGTFLESRGGLKRSLKVDADQYVKGQKVASGLTTLNLHSNVTDASRMNEPLSHRLFRDAGVPAPRAAYARVYVTVDGKYDRQYLGLYSVVENVDKHFLADRFPGAKGGALFKPVSPSLFSDLGDDWKAYTQTYDPKVEPSKAEKKRVMDLCKLVSHADDETLAARLGDFIDLDNFARYLAVSVFLTDLDSVLGPGQNLYLYLHPKTNKLVFIPWDQDHSFGQFKYSQAQREQLSIRRPWEGNDNKFLERVFKVEAFKKLYLAKLDEFSQTIFKPERFHRQVDELAAVLRPAVADESPQKLAAFDRAVAGEPPAGGGGFPFGGGGGGGFIMPGTKPIKGFVDARATSIADQVAGKAEGLTLVQGGFGGFGPPGGGRPGGPGGPGGGQGGPGGFGRVMAGPFVTALDTDKDGKVTRGEFTDGFDRWFKAWNTDGTGVLTDDQLRAGIGRDLSPFRGGLFPGRPGPTSRPGGPPAGG